MGSWIRVAHRGAFNKAIEIGVDAVELDLHGTVDGEIVAIHDSSLDRTTNMCGAINQKTLENIKHADAGSWFHPQFKGEAIPTLEEALACIAGKSIAVLEVKDSPITELVVKTIVEMSLLESVVIISFNISDLNTVRAIEPRIPTGWLIGVTMEKLIQSNCVINFVLSDVAYYSEIQKFSHTFGT